MVKGPDEQDLTLYFNHLIGGISPLVTLDQELRIRFSNDSFLEEFGASDGNLRGREITGVLGLTADYRAEFEKNVARSRQRRVQNCEFDARGRIFGYSIFRFQEETGVILKDITERRLLERKVERLHSELLSLQERERERLARELHDGVGQTILAAKLHFTSFLQDPDKFQERFQTGLDLIDRASQELREIYVNLFPSALRDLGLEAAIRGLARDFLAVKGIQITLEFGLAEAQSSGWRTTVFRIVQEVFSNTMKHSGATHISLSIFENPDDEVELIAEDNGCGFPVEEQLLRSPGYGLQNIRRRVTDLAGDLRIVSAPGQGTRFHIRLPPPREAAGENGLDPPVQIRDE